MAARKKAPPSQTFDAFVHVLGVRGDDGWDAVALEFDLWGHGETFDEAFADLKDLIRMQITFAVQREQPEMIFKAAEPRYFELFHRVQETQLRRFAKSAPQSECDFRTKGLELPPAWAIAAAGKYTVANA